MQTLSYQVAEPHESGVRSFPGTYSILAKEAFSQVEVPQVTTAGVGFQGQEAGEASYGQRCLFSEEQQRLLSHVLNLEFRIVYQVLSELCHRTLTTTLLSQSSV